MDGLPAAIMDENGGWSTAFWYPHAPPARKNRRTHVYPVPGRHLLQILYSFILFFVFVLRAGVRKNAWFRENSRASSGRASDSPSLPAPVAAPYHVAPASSDHPESLRWSSTGAPGRRRQARAARATKRHRTILVAIWQGKGQGKPSRAECCAFVQWYWCVLSKCAPVPSTYSLQITTR
jgi:hypothetical protein